MELTEKLINFKAQSLAGCVTREGMSSNWWSKTNVQTTRRDLWTRLHRLDYNKHILRARLTFIATPLPTSLAITSTSTSVDATRSGSFSRTAHQPTPPLPLARPQSSTQLVSWSALQQQSVPVQTTPPHFVSILFLLSLKHADSILGAVVGGALDSPHTNTQLLHARYHSIPEVVAVVRCTAWCNCFSFYYFARASSMSPTIPDRSHLIDCMLSGTLQPREEQLHKGE